MNADELCDLLVEHFNELADQPITYNAEHPAEAATADKERGDWKVFVLPYEESEEPITLGRETCREEYVASVVVNGPIDATTTKALGIELQKFLRESLKGTELGGCLWAGNEVPSLYDGEALKTKNQFLSLFRPTFYDFA